MSDRIGSAASVPWRVSFFGAILRFLLVAGVPLGPNRLVTIRGRKSGLPRTTPVAIIEVSGRRWVWAPWGEVQWVRNLRAAGRATITPARPQGRRKCDRAGPATASWVLSRHPWSSRAKQAVRCLVHSHRRWGRSRPSVGSGSRSTCLRTPPTRTGLPQSSAE